MKSKSTGFLLAAMAVFAPPAIAADDAYPVGDSAQMFEKVPFDLRVPADVDKAARVGLILVMPGALSDVDAVADRPNVVVHPRVPEGRAGGGWSAGEFKVILRLVAHLASTFSVNPANMHALAVGHESVHATFEMVAFHKKTPFRSAIYYRSRANRCSPPPAARKNMAVLAYDWAQSRDAGRGVKDIEDDLEKRVRLVELRQDDEGLAGDYFKYWLHAMGGAYKPGYDYSFRWSEEAPDRAALVQEIRSGGRGALLYFFAAEDASGTTGPILQNQVFFAKKVRDSAQGVQMLKLDRTKHAALFASFELTATSAVVVIDRKGEVAGSLDGGKPKTKTIAKWLKKAAPKK